MESPIAIWKMLHAPIISLFENLEQAETALKRLLSTLLNSQSHFSQILVPRISQGEGDIPESCFKSFTTWLIGRLLFICSTDSLCGIHKLCHKVQVKILSIIIAKKASFVMDIINQYELFFNHLVNDYLKSDINQGTTLRYFTPCKEVIPNTDILFEGIYIDIQTETQSKNMLKQCLNIFSEIIPLLLLYEGINKQSFLIDMFKLLERCELVIALCLLEFFTKFFEQLSLYNIDFGCEYEKVINKLVLCIERMFNYLDIENSELDNELVKDVYTCIEKLASNIAMKLIDNDSSAECLPILLNVCLHQGKSLDKYFNEEKWMKIKMKSDCNIIFKQKNTITAEQYDMIKEMWADELLQVFLKSPDQKTEEYIIKEMMINPHAKYLNEKFNEQNISNDCFFNNCYAVLNVLFLIVMKLTITKNSKWKHFKLLLGENSILSKSKEICNLYASNRQMFIDNIVQHSKFLLTVTYLSLIYKRCYCIDTGSRKNRELLKFFRKNISAVINEENIKHFSIENMQVIFKLTLLIDLMNIDEECSLQKTSQVCFKVIRQDHMASAYSIISDEAPLIVFNKLLSLDNLLKMIVRRYEREKEDIPISVISMLACLLNNSCKIVVSFKNPPLYILSQELKFYLKCEECDYKRIELEECPLSWLKINVLVERKDEMERDMRRLCGQIKCKTDVRYMLKLASHGYFVDGMTQAVLSNRDMDLLASDFTRYMETLLRSKNLEEKKVQILNKCLEYLVSSTKGSLLNRDEELQRETCGKLKKWGQINDKKVLLPTVQLLLYFVTSPSSYYQSLAEFFIAEISESHQMTPNELYHRYKRDICRHVITLSLANCESFTATMFEVAKSFGFTSYREFVIKESHHLLPYLVPYCEQHPFARIAIIEMATHAQTTPDKLLSDRFPQIYTHIYLNESEQSKVNSFKILEGFTKSTLLEQVKKHFRVVLTEFLLHYCSHSVKVIEACRFLAKNDPDSLQKSNPTTIAQIASFLSPRFLGILAYFDNKLINARVSISVKRSALESFPKILNVMGAEYMTPLRFKILATLRSALYLSSEMPDIVARAWNAFVHNIDTISLGSILIDLSLPLLKQMENAPDEMQKIFEYLIKSNETLLSANLPDLFFLQDTAIPTELKSIIEKHKSRALPKPECILETIEWYLKYYSKDLSQLKIGVLKILNELLEAHQEEVYKEILRSMKRSSLDPVILQLSNVLFDVNEGREKELDLWSAKCVGQIGGCINQMRECDMSEKEELSRKREEKFPFRLNEDSFALSALLQITRAFQYEEETKSIDYYALLIQEMLKVYNICPDGEKRHLWNSLPQNVQQMITPLLTSRYTLSNLSEPKEVIPIFGTVFASTFNEWAFYWLGQMVSKTDCWLSSVYTTLRKDSKCLTLFLPYVLIEAIASKNNHKDLLKEIKAVIDFNPSDDHERSSYEVDSLGETNKIRCCVFELLDFLNRWVLEYAHMKNSLDNPLYLNVKSFMSGLDLREVGLSSGRFGYFARATQYIERCSNTSNNDHLELLAHLYTKLEVPDALSGILMKQCEVNALEMRMAQVVTGRMDEAMASYENIARDLSQTPHHYNQNIAMGECYLGLEQPFTAYNLLKGDADMCITDEMIAEPLLRMGDFDLLSRHLDKQKDEIMESWSCVLAKTLVSYRQDTFEIFNLNLDNELMNLFKEGPKEHSLQLHVLNEVRQSRDLLKNVQDLSATDDEKEQSLLKMLNRWRLKKCALHGDAKYLEPTLNNRILLLQLNKEQLVEKTPKLCEIIDKNIGKIWLQLSKIALNSGNLHRSYMCILQGEKYLKAESCIERAKYYWAKNNKELAFLTLNKCLEQYYSTIVDSLPQKDSRRKSCAKTRLLLAHYSLESNCVDFETICSMFKSAVSVYKHWEKSLFCFAQHCDRGTEAYPNAVFRLEAIKYYGMTLQYGNKYIYSALPRMLCLWLDFKVEGAQESENTNVVKEMCVIIDSYREKLPTYLFLTAFSQIVSRICHPIQQVYDQIKKIIVKLILNYPQHTMWMFISVISSCYDQRNRRCTEIINDLKQYRRNNLLKFISDFVSLSENLIELCNKPIIGNAPTTTVNSLVRALPRQLASSSFSDILIPFDQFRKIILPNTKFNEHNTDVPVVASPLVYLKGIKDQVTVLQSLQKPRKVTLIGSDGKDYVIMLKPKDDLRKDFRLMELYQVVNDVLKQKCSYHQLYIRTYSVVPLNEECGIIQWIHHLEGLRQILLNIYKARGLGMSSKEIRQLAFNLKDPLVRKKQIFEEVLIPRHPPLLDEWFRRIFHQPQQWFEARSRYIRTAAVMSMVGYILGLGDRHGENILLDSTRGDIVHVDFNCLFNKGESFEWPERVPFRLTHNMEKAMGPLGREGMFRKSCERAMHVLSAEISALMSVLRPLVFDPLVSWQKQSHNVAAISGERVNKQAAEHLVKIRNRLKGIIEKKGRSGGEGGKCELSVEGIVNHLIDEATAINNLCQMYPGWSPFM